MAQGGAGRFVHGIWRAAVVGSAVAGVITVAGATSVVLAVKRTKKAALQLPDQFVLQLDLEGKQLVEEPPPLSVNQALSDGPSQFPVSRVVQALHHAAGDDRVKGLLAILDGNQSLAGMAHTQELRNAVLQFRQRKGGGVPTTIYADSYGEYGTAGTFTYYLASAFEKVLMQPTGTLSATGLAAQTPFMRKLLDKWHIIPNIFTRAEYKNAASPLTETGYSKAHREATEGVLDGMMMQVHADVAEARGLSLKQVRKAFDRAPLLASEGVQLGLLTATAYRDDALAAVGASSKSGAATSPGLHLPQGLPIVDPKKRPTLPSPDPKETPATAPGGGLPVVKLSRYLAAMDTSQPRLPAKQMWMQALQAPDLPRVLPMSAAGMPVVALIRAVGPVVAGPGTSGKQEIASGELCETLQAAREDPAIKAIVLRLDTPGGSAVASDSIHHEMLRLKAAGKPVVVSMGNVAASGGYYISAPASRILASPGTITGSIGVLMGKLNVGGLLQDQGINMETIKSGGRNADAMSMVTDFTADQKAQLNRLIDAVYLEFMTRVSDGRGMALADVRKIAKGRVWIGADALELGLVDQLGGLQDAVKVAKQQAGLPTEDETAVLVQPYPPPKPLVVQLLELMKANNPSMAASAAASVGQLAGSGALMAALSGANLEGLLACAAQQAQRSSGVHAGAQLRMPDAALSNVCG